MVPVRAARAVVRAAAPVPRIRMSQGWVRGSGEGMAGGGGLVFVGMMVGEMGMPGLAFC